jgi:branched-chain amino acid transport system permease protein
MVSVDGVAGLTIAFAPIMATMIGGMGTFVGPVLGTAIFQILEEVIMRFTDRIELVMGTIIILVILFFPNGLMGFILKMRQKFVSNIATNDDVGNK